MSAFTKKKGNTNINPKRGYTLTCLKKVTYFSILTQKWRYSPEAIAFIVSLFTIFLIYLPFLIRDNGYFILYVDFNQTAIF